MVWVEQDKSLHLRSQTILFSMEFYTCAPTHLGKDLGASAQEGNTYCFLPFPPSPSSVFLLYSCSFQLPSHVQLKEVKLIIQSTGFDLTVWP